MEQEYGPGQAEQAEREAEAEQVELRGQAELAGTEQANREGE